MWKLEADSGPEEQKEGKEQRLQVNLGRVLGDVK
jgi:hypothetical protein